MSDPSHNLEDFNNSLVWELVVGGSTTKLSALSEQKPFISAEVLAVYAAYLFSVFIVEFLKTLNTEIKEQVKKKAKILAESLIKRVKESFNEKDPVKLGYINKDERLQTLSAGEDLLREALALRDAAREREAAERAGEAEIIAELKKINMTDDEAKDLARRITEKILSRGR